MADDAPDLEGLQQVAADLRLTLVALDHEVSRLVDAMGRAEAVLRTPAPRRAPLTTPAERRGVELREQT